MLAWAKSAAVLGCSLLLMGSKLVIDVPVGGSVVSSSGLVACAGGEVCFVDLDGHHRGESFTAEAAPGFVFAGWRDGSDAICGGSLMSECEGLPGDAREHPRLTLSPRFTAGSGTGAHDTTQFRIESHHRTRYYPVTGRGERALWEQLTDTANPLPPDRHAGAKPLGQASVDYHYDYESAYSTVGTTCRVVAARLVFRFETVLPDLAGAGAHEEGADPGWLALQAKVTEHEAGHQAINRRLVTALPQAMREVGDVPCAELSGRVQSAVAAAAAAVKRANEQYDAHYDDATYALSGL